MEFHMRSLFQFWRGLCLFCSATILASVLQAKSSAWSDGQGGSFKGEPAQALGPYAVFKTKEGGRRLLFRQISPDECRRFHEATARTSMVGASWASAKGDLAADLVDRLTVLEKGKLVPANLKNRPEPRFIVLYYGSGWGPPTYLTVGKIRDAYNRLKRLYGDVFEIVFLGVRHDSAAQEGVAVATQMPWPVARFSDQEKISVFPRYAPEEGERMVIMTNQGVPLFASNVLTTQELARLVDQLSLMLDACDDANPVFWPDRARLLAVSRPIDHPTGTMAPVVANNPFNAASLREAGIRHLVAELSVSAEGKILSATLASDAVLPEKFRQNAIDAITTRCVALPGLSDGKPVIGTCTFDYVVPPKDEKRDLDHRWVQGSASAQISVNSWLLLRPIPVPDSQFSSVLGTDERGVVKLSAFKVGPEAVSGKSQLNAFTHDFFADAGAASVAPTEGQVQLVDEESYRWERVGSEDGLVDFANKKQTDFCVGYAYGEFEADKAGAALLGLGSDDGVKIWLNGELVKDSWVCRSTHIDEDLVSLKLAVGKNRILIKIQNMKGDWSFFLRIRLLPGKLM